MTGGCPAISPDDTLTSGTVGVFYSGVVTASGGTGPYVYSLLYGELPPGLSLDGGTGVISGTPTVVGTFVFTLMAQDENGCSGQRAYSVEVFAS